jgi:hypothetical protein
LGLQQKALEKKIGVEKELRDEITTNTRRKMELQPVDANGNPVVPEKPPTEGQGKARGLLLRATAGVKEYDAVGGLPARYADQMRRHISENFTLQKDATGLMKYVLKPGSRPFPQGFPEKARIGWNAATEFSDATLRQESGAIVGDDEIAARREAILDTEGDTPAVSAQKRGRMTKILGSVALQTGLAGNNQMQLPPEPKNAGLERMERDGVMFIKAPGGWRKEK